MIDNFLLGWLIENGKETECVFSLSELRQLLQDYEKEREVPA